MKSMQATPSPELGHAMAALRQRLLAVYCTDLSSTSWHVRRKAARGLRDLGSEAREAVPRLEILLRDQHARVREAAAWALEKIQACP
jgi:HEAT repeat protein